MNNGDWHVKGTRKQYWKNMESVYKEMKEMFCPVMFEKSLYNKTHC